MLSESNIIKDLNQVSQLTSSLTVPEQDVVVPDEKHDNDHETPSCYYSASHTDNVSTDEHDSLRDLPDPVPQLKELKIAELIDADQREEGVSGLHILWLKFWTVNGEKLIWQSWVSKYSSYINPSYLNEQVQDSGSHASGSGSQAVSSSDSSFGNTSNNLSATRFPFDENSVKNFCDTQSKNESSRSSKIAILSRFLSTSEEILTNDVSEGWNPLSPLSVDCETEVERLLSSRCGSHKSNRSQRTVDSLTNVTRMTVSSVDVASSQSSDSISSVSSVSSTASSEGAPEEEYQAQWTCLWQEHYEQEYNFHYNKFVTEFSVKESKMETENTDEEVHDTSSSESEREEDPSDYIHNNTDWDAMAKLGLPTSFGMKNNKKGPNLTVCRVETTSDVERSKQKLRATLSLIGAEFVEKVKGNLIAQVEYKMKHIRHQNRKLNLGSTPKHIRFDEQEAESVDKKEVEEKIEEKNVIESLTVSIENDALMNDSQEKPVQKRKKRKRKIAFPPEMEANSKIKKFWPRRFSLFSKFDQGIKLDEESWYSVTPEIIAKHSAERCACDLIIDAFCGAGGNAIQFAFTCKRVIAIDIDPKKIELAKNNATVYGVADKIDFIVGDFLQLAESLKGNAVFMSPPWGGPSYTRQKVYDLETMLQPVSFSTLFQLASGISKNIAVFLPKNSNTATLVEMAGLGGKVEIEQDFINNKQVSITAYYNDLVKEQ